MTSHHPGAIQESTQSHLIRTKDIAIIQEIPRDLGILCPESKADTYMYFRYYTLPNLRNVADAALSTLAQLKFALKFTAQKQ